MSNRPYTVFCDIDGTLVEHNPPSVVANENTKLKLLPQTLEKLNEWDSKGYHIVLVTGRKESMRSITEKQLREVGIFYDQLIMGITGGKRILINDKKPSKDEPTAYAHSFERNYGIKDVNI